jgi:hypothetical protein
MSGYDYCHPSVVKRTGKYSSTVDSQPCSCRVLLVILAGPSRIQQAGSCLDAHDSTACSLAACRRRVPAALIFA